MMSLARVERTLARSGLTMQDAHGMTDIELLKVPELGRKGLHVIRQQAQAVVVTRHTALLDLLAERGLLADGAKVLNHVTPKDVRGKHVIGVLPLALAALAASVTEIPLTLTAEDRGKELDLERLREVAGDPVTYQVMTTNP